MLTQLLQKIIRTRVGPGRFFMAAAGLTIAMLLILSAVQIQVNYNELLYGKSNQDSIANFLVVAKVIDGNKRENVLSKEEISNLRKQPFIEEVGLLTASRLRFRHKAQAIGFLFIPTCFLKVCPMSLLT